ncbi:hypothetical protein NKR23_g1316 [Pleurostoma richardsiae]|uniref:C3H1-type domain-containing protein n=1 Tax=Pleurostoma richardsiae TaxID=41990 RepID=A0AA38S5A8_9PEZI|nr:hypothetical protein NKR23_g1316 [Pleurostoma richardsiae]
MSSPDISYSSGASVTSTRDTSPDSPHGARDATTLATRLDLYKLTDPVDMDRNPFHTANERRERTRLTLDPQQRSQQANLGRGLPTPNPLPPRSIASTNWRAAPSPSIMDNNIVSASSPSDAQFTAFGPLSTSNSTTYNNILGLQREAHNMADIHITDHQMDEVYSYCVAREDGQFTRLVPVDMLPRISGIPPRSPDADGMIVLPTPRKVAPHGQPSYSQSLQLATMTPPASPVGGSSTDIQSRIDSIIAASPAPPAAAQNSNKRTKIYCDKWIHDGTCAFTQQGCKYKHEMPTDKETQEKLGLFHGFPAWWKKLQIEQQRPIAPSSNSPLPLDTSTRIGHAPPHQRPSPTHQAAQALRQPERPQEHHHPEGHGPVPFLSPRGGFSRGPRHYQGRLPNNSFQTSPFGPIAPPSKADAEARTELAQLQPSGANPLRPPTKTPTSNLYLMLETLDSTETRVLDDEADEETTHN